LLRLFSQKGLPRSLEKNGCSPPLLFRAVFMSHSIVDMVQHRSDDFAIHSHANPFALRCGAGGHCHCDWDSWRQRTLLLRGFSA